MLRLLSCADLISISQQIITSLQIKMTLKFPYQQKRFCENKDEEAKSSICSKTFFSEKNASEPRLKSKGSALRNLPIKMKRFLEFNSERRRRHRRLQTCKQSHIVGMSCKGPVNIDPTGYSRIQGTMLSRPFSSAAHPDTRGPPLVFKKAHQLAFLE